MHLKKNTQLNYSASSKNLASLKGFNYIFLCFLYENARDDQSEQLTNLSSTTLAPGSNVSLTSSTAIIPRNSRHMKQLYVFDKQKKLIYNNMKPAEPFVVGGVRLFI